MLDSQGDFLWAHAYSMDSEVTLVNATVEDATTPNTFAIMGHVLVAPYTSRFDVCFAKITPSVPPAASAEKVYTAYVSPGTGHYLFPYQMIQTGPDFIICGTAENMSTGETFSFVFKVDGSDGDIIWQNCFNVGTRSEALALSAEADGTVWVAGNTDLEQNTPFSSWKNFYLAKLDPTDGDILQAHYYDEDNYQSCVDLLAPQTGEHILDGYHYTSSITFSRFFVKTDPNGIALNCSSIPVEPTDKGDLISASSESLTISTFDESDFDITTLSPYVQDLDTDTQDMGCTDCNCE